jgi:hypothetical protein
MNLNDNLNLVQIRRRYLKEIVCAIVEVFIDIEKVCPLTSVTEHLNLDISPLFKGNTTEKQN